LQESARVDSECWSQNVVVNEEAENEVAPGGRVKAELLVGVEAVIAFRNFSVSNVVVAQD
jgi:hypothetical protein